MRALAPIPILLRRSRFARNLVGVCAASLLFLAFWALYWEPSSLVVVHRTIAITPWHPEHSGLKVAILSDLHVGAPYKGLNTLPSLVEKTNSESPDLILLLGDYVIGGIPFGRHIAPEPIAAQLKKLHAPLGVIAVLGNHDWLVNGKRIRTALESQGIIVLDNQNLKLNYRGKSFWISGFADLWTRGNFVLPTLSKIHDGDPVIAIMHNPDLFPTVPPRVSLSLAGHTHGGQVNLPFLGRMIVPSKYGQRYAYGLIEESGKLLFVTGGIGTSIFPVRLGVPPEIVILTLNAQ